MFIIIPWAHLRKRGELFFGADKVPNMLVDGTRDVDCIFCGSKRAHSVHLREHSVNFREHSVHFRQNADHILCRSKRACGNSPTNVKSTLGNI